MRCGSGRFGNVFPSCHDGHVYELPIYRVLLCIDIAVSVGLGRPCAIRDEESVSPFASLSWLIGIYFHSFDLDFPIECDDEYWYISEQDEEASKPFSPTFLQQPVVFKQPADKPSLITGFVLTLKLNKVLAVMLRTIVSICLLFFLPCRMTNPSLQYSLKENQVLLGFIGEHGEQQIVSELDSALNQWVDSVPDHRKFKVLLLT